MADTILSSSFPGIVAQGLVAEAGIGMSAATAGSGTTTTTVALASALSAVLTALAIGALILGVRAVRRWRAADDTKPTMGNKTTFMPDTSTLGYSNYGSKFSRGHGSEDYDDLSVSPSTVTSLS